MGYSCFRSFNELSNPILETRNIIVWVHQVEIKYNTLEGRDRVRTEEYVDARKGGTFYFHTSCDKTT